MPAPESLKQDQYGLYVIGVVMAKNKYPGKDGKPDRFGVDVAVPGVREMLSITTPPEKWGGFLEMQDFKNKVSFRTYKGAVYFELV